MKQLEVIAVAFAFAIAFASLPVTIAVRRLVVPWRKRYKEDGHRIEDGRVVEIAVGPFKFVDRPVDPASDALALRNAHHESGET